jgi:hypothetical protein
LNYFNISLNDFELSVIPYVIYLISELRLVGIRYSLLLAGALHVCLLSSDGSIYRKYRDISPISILSVSYRIGVVNIVFFDIIVSVKNNISVVFDMLS